MQSIFISGGHGRFKIDADDGARRFAESLGQLIQVNQLCVLVGSGASFHLGSPRIRTIETAELEALCAAAGVPLDDSSGQLLGHLASGPTDLEGLLGQLTSAVGYAKSFALARLEIGGESFGVDVVRTLFGSVNVALASACNLPAGDVAAPFDDDPWLAHREFFRRVLGSRRPDAPRVKVFTTNYDTVIEQALDSCGVRYFDGFVGGVTRTLDLSSYGNDLYSRSGGARSLVPLHDVVHLYKLHGSLTWRIVDKPGAVSALRIVQASGPPNPGELAVIYPTPTKEVDVVGHPYADLLREFGMSLAAPECALLVIGYGFADEHINRLIYQALSFNSTLQILVADPFGVVLGESEELDPPRTDSAVGRLSAIEDARVSVVTGDAATFVRMSRCLPDVAATVNERQDEVEHALAEALLGPEFGNA